MIAQFLKSRTPLAEETELWGNGLLQLRVTAYLGDELPPIEYITSVRALVFQHQDLLTVTDSQRTHIMPGGRIEAGETLEQTLRRELLEETGWTLGDISLIGFKHFHHLKPKPPEYKYPYPDFIQPVYLAQAGAFVPASLASEYVAHGFRSISEMQMLPLSPIERLFLEDALHWIKAVDGSD